MPETIKPTIASEFAVLDTARSASLERKRECAGLVLPSLLPEEGHNETVDYMVPYSSSPARMTAALAAKIVATLAPLNNLQYFEIAISDEVIKDEDPTELIKKLTSKQASIVGKLNNTNIREAAYLVAQQIIQSATISGSRSLPRSSSMTQPRNGLGTKSSATSPSVMASGISYPIGHLGGNPTVVITMASLCVKRTLGTLGSFRVSLRPSLTALPSTRSSGGALIPRGSQSLRTSKTATTVALSLHASRICSPSKQTPWST